VQVDREELEDDVVAVERVCRLLAEVCIQQLVLIANARTDSPNNSLNNRLLSAIVCRLRALPQTVGATAHGATAQRSPSEREPACRATT
jgi:hypothetical protein